MIAPEELKNVYSQHFTRLTGAQTSLEQDASCIVGSDVTPLCQGNRLLRWRPWLLRCIVGSDVTPLCQGNRLLRWRPCCVTIVHGIRRSLKCVSPPNLFPYSGHSGRTRCTTLREDRSPGRPLDALFQPLCDPSESAFNAVVNKPMRAHALSSAVVSQITTFFEDKDAIRSARVA